MTQMTVVATKTIFSSFDKGAALEQLYLRADFQNEVININRY